MTRTGAGTGEGRNPARPAATPRHTRHGARMLAARLLGLLALACYLTGTTLCAWLAWNIADTDTAIRHTADHTATIQAAWPAENQKTMLDQARAYDQRAAQAGGDAIPFGGDGTQGGRADPGYMHALDTGDGSMAVLDIPTISVHQPIYHTTDDDALESGIGHVYGTALPIGDPGTHAALAGHTGTGTRTDLTRIRELRPGSYLYITILGKTMGYQVDRIRTVDPDDFHAITDTTPGQARLTLVTCTPPVLNTQRLLVSAVRRDIPDPIPPANTQHDTTLTAAAAAGGVILAGTAGLAIRRHRRHRRRRHSRHAHTHTPRKEPTHDPLA